MLIRAPRVNPGGRSNTQNYYFGATTKLIIIVFSRPTGPTF